MEVKLEALEKLHFFHSQNFTRIYHRPEGYTPVKDVSENERDCGESIKLITGLSAVQ